MGNLCLTWFVKILISLFWLVLSFSSMVCAETISFNEVSEIRSARFGSDVVRYVLRYGRRCLEVQVLDPDNSWVVKSSKDFCSIDGLSFEEDFADAGFFDLFFSEYGIQMGLSFTPLVPTGEQVRKCRIPIRQGKILALKCGKPARR